jgi:hypothetical protein
MIFVYNIFFTPSTTPVGERNLHIFALVSGFLVWLRGGEVNIWWEENASIW